MLFPSLKPIRRATPPSTGLAGPGQRAHGGVRRACAPAAIVLDLQHGLWERGTVEAAIASTGQRVPVIARCADNTHAAIAQALDAGAASVLVPLIETVDDARRALDASRYPPRGSRSAGGVRPLLGGVAAMLEADTQVSVGLMIETVAGVENAQAIAALPGIDYLFIGTGDLSLSRGSSDPDVIGHDCAQVLAAARARPALRHLHRQRRGGAPAHGQGYRMAVAASDIDLLKQGLQSALAARRPPSASPAAPPIPDVPLPSARRPCATAFPMQPIRPTPTASCSARRPGA